MHILERKLKNDLKTYIYESKEHKAEVYYSKVLNKYVVWFNGNIILSTENVIKVRNLLANFIIWYDMKLNKVK